MRARYQSAKSGSPFRRLFLAVFLAASGIASVHAADWLQFGGDPAHTGYNAMERGYSTATGNRLVFPAVTLAAVADIAPIFLGAVATNSGTKDVLFVVARNGTLTALNAADGAVIWSAPHGGVQFTTSAAAVDPNLQFVYSYGLDGKVHKHQVGDGVEIVSGGWPQLATLKPAVEKGVSGLTIAIAADAQAYLYSAMTSYYDTGDFQGHLTTINLASGVQNVFNAQCSNLTIHFVQNGITSGPGQNDCTKILSPKPGQTANSGIWGRPGATYDATLDRVYFATGNGLFDPNNDLGNGNDWGDSVLALHADGTGTAQGFPVDSWTPVDDAALLQNDVDLGATSPAILPAPAGSNVTHLGLQGGKDACVRLLNLQSLNGAPGAGHTGGELQAVNLPNSDNHCIDGGNANNFLTQPAVWVNPADQSTWVFIAHGAGIVGYTLVLDAAGSPSLQAMWSSTDSGTSPVVANGTLYYGASHVLRALDATSGQPVWSSGDIGNVHWQSPIVVNGRLYMIDQTSKLWVYQLDGIFRASFE